MTTFLDVMSLIISRCGDKIDQGNALYNSSPLELIQQSTYDESHACEASYADKVVRWYVVLITLLGRDMLQCPLLRARRYVNPKRLLYPRKAFARAILVAQG